jgi:hypothetical protein
MVEIFKSFFFDSIDAGPAGIHDHALVSLLSVGGVAFAFAAFAITVYYCNFRKIKNKLIKYLLYKIYTYI